MFLNDSNDLIKKGALFQILQAKTLSRANAAVEKRDTTKAISPCDSCEN